MLWVRECGGGQCKIGSMYNGYSSRLVTIDIHRMQKHFPLLQREKLLGHNSTKAGDRG